MTMTAAGLASAIKASQGDAENTTLQDDANLKLATAIVTYLQANAVVLPTALVAPPLGGPVTGTGQVV